MRDQKIDRLKKASLFANLTPKELELVAEITTEVALRPGQVLAREGHAGHEAFVILDGTADISVGGQKVASAGPGEIVGELALLLHDERQATVVAATDMDVMVIEPGRFQSLMEDVPRLSKEIALSLARRLRATDKLLHG